MLFALLAVAAVAQAAQWTVLEAPSSIVLSSSAQAPSFAQVSAITADLLGFPSKASWAGVSSANLFNRPQAAVTLIFDGLDSFAVESAPVSYPVIATCKSSVECVRSVVSASGDGLSHTLAAKIAHLFPSSMSAVFTTSATLANAVSGLTEHDIIVGDSEIESFLASGVLGSDVTFDKDAQTVTVGEAVLSLTKADVRAFIGELASTYARTKAVSPSNSSPDVITIVISTSASCKMLKQTLASLASRFASAIQTLVSAKYNGRALIQAVSFELSANIVAAHIASARRSAALGATSSQLEYDSTWDWSNVPYCTDYQYYCRTDSKGNPWDANSGCQSNCTSVGAGCECVWGGCLSNSTVTSIMFGLQECIQCAPGFVLTGGYCYVDSIYPVTFNIVLWLGLGVALALIATCFTIGTIDAGGNAAASRTGRAKTN